MQKSTMVKIVSRSKKSLCNKYRFYLSKIWDINKNIVTFIGINPSKADELYWDQTVCNCNNLAVQWGYGGFIMLNLYPIYNTSPQGLNRNSSGNYQNRNDRIIKLICQLPSVDKVIIATGGNRENDTKIIMKKIAAQKLYCIKKNSDGSFLHPSPQALHRYTWGDDPEKI